MLKVSALVTIPTEGGDFPALELQTLMAVFRGRYVFSLKEYHHFAGHMSDQLNEEAVFKVSREYNSSPDLEHEVRYGFHSVDPESDLFISELRRINPIEILVLALAGPLAAAVVLSGGKIQIGSLLRVELPPIGKGIEKLRQALQPTIPQKIEDIRMVRQRTSTKPTPPISEFDVE
jgi:hypothetical protein